MKLVVGTYEGSLIGWESDYEADASGRTLSLAYAFSAHDASVKALAIDGRGGTTLVTGSSDETIKVYSLRTRREIGSLLEHRDAVTALDFFGGDSLLSGDHAGAICIWRTSDWTNLHTMTGHKCVCCYGKRARRRSASVRVALRGPPPRTLTTLADAFPDTSQGRGAQYRRAPQRPPRAVRGRRQVPAPVGPH